MKWSVQGTHAATGEPVVVRVEAGSRDAAAALARDGGIVVHDCFRAGRGFLKVVRVLGWVWFGLFAVFAALIFVLAFGGMMDEPGEINSGLRAFTVAGPIFAVGLPGWLIAVAATHALGTRDRRAEPQGFEVVPASRGKE